MSVTRSNRHARSYRQYRHARRTQAGKQSEKDRHTHDSLQEIRTGEKLTARASGRVRLWHQTRIKPVRGCSASPILTNFNDIHDTKKVILGDGLLVYMY